MTEMNIQEILTKAQTKAHDPQYASAVLMKWSRWQVFYWFASIFVFITALFSASLLTQAQQLTNLMNISSVFSLITLPWDLIVIAIIVHTSIFLMYKIEWSGSKSLILVSSIVLGLLGGWIFTDSLAPLTASIPSKQFGQTQFITALQQQGYDTGTIATSISRPNSADYTISLDQQNTRQYLMPSPPFVPKKGDKLWLKFVQEENSVARIVDMGLIQ